MDKKELNLILREGEGQIVEFKENLDKQFSKEVEENLEYLKANASPEGNANKIIFD